MNGLNSYIGLVKQFTERGYRCKLFTDEVIEEKHDLLLRHDVDFDVAKAWNMASAEHDNGFIATYFFLLRSQSYNLLAPENLKMVQEIKGMGHEVSLHFDPVIYEDYVSGLKKEIALFDDLLEVKTKIISFHRPNPFFLEGGKLFGDAISHTYERRFFKDMKYVSDSGGSFRYGHPLDSAEYARGNTMHLLTHPIWWDTPGDSTVEKLATFLGEGTARFSRHMSDNCIPWRDHLSVVK